MVGSLVRMIVVRWTSIEDDRPLTGHLPAADCVTLYILGRGSVMEPGVYKWVHGLSQAPYARV